MKAANKRIYFTACGYALFTAVNATAVWGGVFPFLPVSFQTSEIVNVFFLSQSLVLMATILFSMIWSFLFPHQSTRSIIWVSCTFYIISWSFLVAAIYIDSQALAFTVFGGICMGFATGGSYIAWQRTFAAMPSQQRTQNIITSALIAPLFYFALYLIPVAITSFLIPLVFVPLFALCLVLTGRKCDFNQTMFTDTPQEHVPRYRQFVSDYWRSALSIGTIALECGLLRAIIVVNPQEGIIVNVASMLGMFIGAVTLLFLWQKKPVRLNIDIAFRFLFPFIITAFILLPLLGNNFTQVFMAALYAIYSAATLLMIIQCAAAASERSVNPIFAFGFVGGVVYLMHDAGYGIGLCSAAIGGENFDPLTTLSLVACYISAIAFYVGQGGLHNAISPNKVSASYIELVKTNAAPSIRQRETAGIGDEAFKNGVATKTYYEDKISLKCSALAKRYDLSKRETTIVELIAHGQTVKLIAENLYISENTARTHMKRIYTKLDVHKKKELIELLNDFDPSRIDS